MSLFGDFTLGNKNCSVHQVSLCFGENGYEIEIDGKNYIYDFYLRSGEAHDMFKRFIGTDKTIEMDDKLFEKFKKLFDVLSEQLEEISNHSDYNSDDYMPFTSDVANSLNEKYVNFFKCIEEQIS